MREPNVRTFILALFFTSTLISAPSIAHLPRLLPFLSTTVRAASPMAVTALGQEGAWLVNADLAQVMRDETLVCFAWEYAYRSRFALLPTRSITTCIHENEE